MEKIALVAGVDEAGRGPLCGDVYAAAVILNPNHAILGLDDSKKLTALKRERLEQLIKEQAYSYCVAHATVLEIETMNILQATLLAMRRAISGLLILPELVLVDGNQDPHCFIPTQTIIKGDGLHACISAASILAKTARDRAMLQADLEYPEYGFAKHKGYGTKMHLAALLKYGATPIHRKTFSPVAAVIHHKEV